jgi:hypothetical protein
MAYDPLFAAPGDYHLRSDSPCNNAGTNQAWMAGAVDLDGRDRILLGTVDIGAYESAVVDPPVVSGDTHYVVPGNPGARSRLHQLGHCGGEPRSERPLGRPPRDMPWW